MKKIHAELFALIAIFLGAKTVMAATDYIGQINQQVTFSGIAQPVSGTVSVSGSTVTVAVPMGTKLPVDVSASTITVVGVGGSSVAVQGSVFAVAIATNSPAITRLSASGSSAQLLAANATRHALECETSCANTDKVFINFGAGAATNLHKPLEACTSWSPPSGINVTSAIQVIVNSGTQVILCIEY